MTEFANKIYTKYYRNKILWKVFIFTESPDGLTMEFSMLIVDGSTENFLSSQKLYQVLQVIEKISVWFDANRDGKWTKNFLSPCKRDK